MGKDPTVSHHRLPPYPGTLEPALPAPALVGLLMHQQAVLDLTTQPQDGALVQGNIPGKGLLVFFPLGLSLFGQPPAGSAAGLFRGGKTCRKPEVAPQVVAGTSALLD